MSSLYDFYSNNGLQRIYNNFGIHSLDRGVNVPQPALGIGFAELTAPVPLLVSYSPILKQPDISPVVSIEDTYIKTQGKSLQMDTFSQVGYYGDALGVTY